MSHRISFLSHCEANYHEVINSIRRTGEFFKFRNPCSHDLCISGAVEKGKSGLLQAVQLSGTNPSFSDEMTLQ